MPDKLKQKLNRYNKLLVASLMTLLIGAFMISPVYATPTATCTKGPNTYCCGGGTYTDSSGKTQTYPSQQTSIDLGCKGEGNPIMDLAFAIIRLLSDGVGIVVIGSVIVGGIQYSTSRSDPQASSRGITRIRTALIALLIYIFAYAILNYLIPNFFIPSS